MLRVLTGVAGAGLSFLAGGLAKERLDQQRENTALLTAFRENVYIKSLSVSAEEQQKQRERSFIMIKPDGVQRGLVGEIIKRFEQKGFKLVAIRMMRPGLDHLKAHYADLSARPFFPGLVSYMDSGPVVAMCWEGDGVVRTGRLMLGETNPRDSKPGTIRGDYCIQVRQTETGNVSEAHVVADIMTSTLFLRWYAYFEIKKCRSDFVVFAVDKIGIFYRNIFTE